MFWERFYKLCIDNNTKPNPVGKKLGISSGLITKWKNGTMPNSDMLKKIAKHFNVSADYLLGLSDVPRADESNINDYSNNFRLSEREKELIQAYRKSEMKAAVDRILDLEDEKETEKAIEKAIEEKTAV